MAGLSVNDLYKAKHVSLDTDPNLPNELNTFYCRFENKNSTQPFTVDASDPTAPPFLIREHEVRNLLCRQNSRKAAGPDQISPASLKHCAYELAPILTDIFNCSLAQQKVPDCFKSAVIVPVPKKNNPSCMNDYRPIALTSVIMKVFERLVCNHLSSVTQEPYQFAYRGNRSVDDAVSLCLHSILQHLEGPGNYARVLFVDFSSAFNTILPSRLYDKLLHMGVQQSLCRWVLDFLTGRVQVVKCHNKTSKPLTISTGAPQGCVLSPLLFSLYTNDCISHCQSVGLFKFADDTTVVGLITNNDETKYRNQITSLVDWCSTNNLDLNPSKTKEVVVDFNRRHEDHLPLAVNNTEVQ